MNRDEWLAGLHSDDEERVKSALRSACPCRGSSQLYEEFMPLLHSFRKDPRPAVRAVAIHLVEDAMTVLAEQDGEANGWVRNKPGGNGRRGETRRAYIRYGFQ